MDNQVRLLPALIGAAAVVVILRLVAMSTGLEASFTSSGTALAADAAPAAAPAAAAAPASGAPTPTSAPAASSATSTPATGATPPSSSTVVATPQSGAPVAASAAQDQAPPSSGAGQAQNKGEADILHALSERREALDARENELVLREQLLAATQKQVDDKIAELKQIQSKLDSMLAQRDDAQKAQLTSLIKMYEAMKPDQAAKIFEKLDPRILADVAGGMKPAKVGPVLAAMEPAKAQELTALLANRLVLPQPQGLPQRADASGASGASGAPAMPGATPIIGDPNAAAAAQPAATPQAPAQPAG